MNKGEDIFGKYDLFYPLVIWRGERGIILISRLQSLDTISFIFEVCENCSSKRNIYIIVQSDCNFERIDLK